MQGTDKTESLPMKLLSSSFYCINMKNKELENAEKLLRYTKEYVSLLKKYDKLAERLKFGLFEEQHTRKQIAKLNNDRRSTGEALMRVQHEIHCICVELELAKYEEWRYRDTETGKTASGFSSQHLHFRKPDIKI